MEHLIFVCKYRKPLLTRLGCEVKAIMLEVASEYGFCIDEMEVDKDHIHLLVRYSPAQYLLWLVRTLKQVSTYGAWPTTKFGWPASFGRSEHFGVTVILHAIPEMCRPQPLPSTSKTKAKKPALHPRA